MAEPSANRWRYRALYVFVAAFVAFVQLLPLNAVPGRLPGPDVMALLTFCWVILRPNLLPIALIAAVFLMFDLLMMRPPGLWAGLVVLGVEFLRSRRPLFRSAPFPVQWLLIAVVVAVLTVINLLVLSLFGVPQPTLGFTMIGMIFTVLMYPVVVLLGARAIGLRMPTSDTDHLGRSW